MSLVLAWNSVVVVVVVVVVQSRERLRGHLTIVSVCVLSGERQPRSVCLSPSVCPVEAEF